MCVSYSPRYNPLYLQELLDLGDEPTCEYLAENIDKLSKLYQEHMVDDEQRESMKEKIRATQGGENFGKVDADGNLV